MSSELQIVRAAPLAERLVPLVGKTRVDLTGRRFGRLRAVERVGAIVLSTGARVVVWACECDCGTRTLVRHPGLASGHTRSCGCLMRESRGRTNLTHGATRGRAQTREHKAWANMLTRCRNPRANFFARYGGRGIKVCERWEKFENFLSDMGPSPGRGYSLDRVDSDGHYEPGNCRWATLSRQARNTSRNRLYEHGGVRLCLSDWSERLGLSADTIRSRLHRGDSVADALRPAGTRKAGA